MDAVFNFDRSILLWIQEAVRAQALTPAVKVITHLGDKGLFWILLTLILMIFRRTRRIGVTCMISMVIGLVITNLVIKNWVARIRPYELIDELELIIERQHDFSFPSGHTTNSFACAWVIFCMAKRRYGIPTLLLAILISLSRLYVGVHYPTDVFAGVLIGIFSACCAILIVRFMRRHFRWFRRLTRVPKRTSVRAKRRAGERA